MNENKKPKKGSKDIIKVIHVTPVVYPQFYEVSTLFEQKTKQHNLPLYLQNMNLQHKSRNERILEINIL